MLISIFYEMFVKYGGFEEYMDYINEQVDEQSNTTTSIVVKSLLKK